MDNCIPSTLLSGVVPAVCDAEAGEEGESATIRVVTSDSDPTSPIESRLLTNTNASPEGVLMRRLRLLMTELCTAIRSALDDERNSAEDSLRRALELLDSFGASDLPTQGESRGGLAPWQIRKVTAHIDGHLDRAIRNEELASVARLNSSHFGRAFRNSFGEPPHEYVIRRRVERAQGLMLATDASLSEIALDCGLADQSHLTRLFRRVVGESPRAWRRARIAAPS